jgi:hypothetical protein
LNLLQAGLVLAGIGWLAAPAASPLAADQLHAGEPVRELIARLGAKDFCTRELASAALEQQGEATPPGLRQALAANPDLEIRVRANG